MGNSATRSKGGPLAITYPNNRRVATVHCCWFNRDVAFDIRVQVPVGGGEQSHEDDFPNCVPKADCHIFRPSKDVSLLEGTPRETESAKMFSSR